MEVTPPVLPSTRSFPFTPSGAGAQFALLMLAFGREFPAVTVGKFALGMRLATTAFNVAIGSCVMIGMLGTLRWRRAFDRLNGADWAGTNAGHVRPRDVPAATSRS